MDGRAGGRTDGRVGMYAEMDGWVDGWLGGWKRSQADGFAGGRGRRRHNAHPAACTGTRGGPPLTAQARLRGPSHRAVAAPLEHASSGWLRSTLLAYILFLPACSNAFLCHPSLLALHSHSILLHSSPWLESHSLLAWQTPSAPIACPGDECPPTPRRVMTTQSNHPSRLLLHHLVSPQTARSTGRAIDTSYLM